MHLLAGCRGVCARADFRRDTSVIGKCHTVSKSMSGHTCRTSVQAVCQHLRPQSKRGLRTSLTRHAFCNIHHWHLPTSSKTRAAAKLSAAAGCEEDSSRHSRCHRLSIAKHRQQTEQSVPRISMHVAAVIAAVISLSDPAWAELQV